MLDHPGTGQEHTIPPSHSRGTCSGVPARSQPQKNAVFLCPNTGGSLGPPSLQTQGRGSDTQHYARDRYGVDRRKKDPQPRMARDKQRKGLLPRVARSERQQQGRLDHVRCTYTEHTTPPSPSRGTCSGVSAGPQLLRGAVFLCQYTGRPVGPSHGKCGLTPRTGSARTGNENARSTKQSPDG